MLHSLSHMASSKPTARLTHTAHLRSAYRTGPQVPRWTVQLPNPPPPKCKTGPQVGSRWSRHCTGSLQGRSRPGTCRWRILPVVQVGVGWSKACGAFSKAAGPSPPSSVAVWLCPTLRILKDCINNSASRRGTEVMLQFK